MARLMVIIAGRKVYGTQKLVKNSAAAAAAGSAICYAVSVAATAAAASGVRTPSANAVRTAPHRCSNCCCCQPRAAAPSTRDAEAAVAQINYANSSWYESSEPHPLFSANSCSLEGNGA